MADELSLDTIKEMKKAEFIAAFKNKALWKKAKAVIVLTEYKLEGKKTTVAIPFKKETEMKLEMKRLKKNKLHILKKSGGGLITVENDGPEGLKAKIELLNGGLKPEILQIKAVDLFGKIKATLEVVIAANAELEPDTDTEVSSDADVSDDTEEPINSTKEETTTHEKVVPGDKNKDIKLVLAKIVKLNKGINLKDGLQDSDLKIAEELKTAIREFAALLKTADAAARQEYGETFLKTKKIYAKLEEEIKRLKALQVSDLDSELNDSLGETSADDDANSDEVEEEEEEEENEEPTTVAEAKAKNKELMDEINETLKEINLYAMV